MSNELTTLRHALAPTNFAEAVQFATLLSKSSMIPEAYRNKPENVLLAMQWGAEVGLAPLQALQNIAVINGRPSVYGDALMAMVIGSPLCEGVAETFEGSGEGLTAICTATRRGQPPVVSRFAVADAKRAGLWGKGGPWTQYPRRMLQMRARSFALRDAFPDILRGVVAAEEAEDHPAAPKDITSATDTRAALDAFAAPMPDVSLSHAAIAPYDSETGEIVGAAAQDAAMIETAARAAASRGTAALRAHMRGTPRAEREQLAPLVGTASQPGVILLMAQRTDAALREAGPPDDESADAFGLPALSPAPAGDSAIADMLGGSPAPPASCQVRLLDETSTGWAAWESAMWAMIEAGDDKAAIRADNKGNLEVFEQLDSLAHHKLLRALGA